MNPLTSVKGSIVTAFALAAILSVWLSLLAGAEIGAYHQIVRLLHLVAGVMWIGLLYYFNVVQVPGLADAAADKGGPGGAGISKYIAPRALWWFRWAAVLTWVTGAYYLAFGFGSAKVLHDAFTLQPGFRIIGVGAWLGTIMLFNVWVFIWPNQRRIINATRASEKVDAAWGRRALYASRTNFTLSFPMLFFMAGSSHYPLGWAGIVGVGLVLGALGLATVLTVQKWWAPRF